MTENEQLDYNDVLVSLASTFQHFGVRRVMSDFQAYYPDYYQEMKVQMERMNSRPMPVLLQKKPIG